MYMCFKVVTAALMTLWLLLAFCFMCIVMVWLVKVQSLLSVTVNVIRLVNYHQLVPY